MQHKLINVILAAMNITQAVTKRLVLYPLWLKALDNFAKVKEKISYVLRDVH